jgi:hypothetical protein
MIIVISAGQSNWVTMTELEDGTYLKEATVYSRIVPVEDCNQIVYIARMLGQTVTKYRVYKTFEL